MTTQTITQEIRRIEDGKWYWIKKKAAQDFVPKVGFLAMCVYHLLASMVDEKQKCFPSQQYIAEHLGCSRASISRAIHSLKTEGLVSVSKGASNHAIYCLLKIRGSTDATEMSHGSKKDTSSMDTNNTKLINDSVVSASQKQPFGKEELLAREIAETVCDARADKFLPIVKRYDEPFIREILSQIKTTKTIKKSRIALFFYLVKYYAKRRT